MSPLKLSSRGTELVQVLKHAGEATADELSERLGVTVSAVRQQLDGLLTGWHEPAASHLLMLEAVAGRKMLDDAYRAALAGRYLWHEFGDLHLLLP